MVPIFRTRFTCANITIPLDSFLKRHVAYAGKRDGGIAKKFQGKRFPRRYRTLHVDCRRNAERVAQAEAGGKDKQNR